MRYAFFHVPAISSADAGIELNRNVSRGFRYPASRAQDRVKTAILAVGRY